MEGEDLIPGLWLKFIGKGFKIKVHSLEVKSIKKRNVITNHSDKKMYYLEHYIDTDNPTSLKFSVPEQFNKDVLTSLSLIKN